MPTPQGHHPGVFLRRELARLGISLNQCSRDIRVPLSRISAIANGKRSVSTETALRFARYFGTSPRLWLDRQSAYDLKLAERKTGKTVRREVVRRAA